TVGLRTQTRSKLNTAFRYRKLAPCNREIEPPDLSSHPMPSDQFFSLSFEQQIGQFFFIGLPGTEVDQQARELIEEIKPGGIILFGRNVESPQQVRKLLDDARALIPTPPLCGIY